MLVLSRKEGEQIVIGEHVVVTITEIRGDKVRVGIEAPKDVTILRKELEDKQQPQPVVPRLMR